MPGPVLLDPPTTSTTGGPAATTLPATLPAGLVAGAVLLIWCASGVNLTWSAPGWTAATPAGSLGGSNQLLWLAATGSESSPVTVTASGNDPWVLICAGYGQANGGAPFDPPGPPSGQMNPSSTTVTVPGLTTTIPDDTLVWFGMTQGFSGSVPPSITVPGSFVPECSQVNTSSSVTQNVGAVMADYSASLPAGPTGNQNGSIPSSHPNGGQMISLAALVPSVVKPLGANWWPRTRSYSY